jgi:hypothetical protein
MQFLTLPIVLNVPAKLSRKNIDYRRSTEVIGMNGGVRDKRGTAFLLKEYKNC